MDTKLSKVPISMGRLKPSCDEDDNNNTIDYGSDTCSTSSASTDNSPALGEESKNISNCWSQPCADDFYIRSSNYLTNKSKIRSGPFLMTSRGAQLLITEECPENVGR